MEEGGAGVGVNDEIEDHVGGLSDSDWDRVEQVANGQITRDTLRLDSNVTCLWSIANYSDCGKSVSKILQKVVSFPSWLSFLQEVVNCINAKNKAGVVVSIKKSNNPLVLPVLYVDITPKLAKNLVKAYAVERNNRELKIKHSMSHLLPSEIVAMGWCFEEVLDMDIPNEQLQEQSIGLAIYAITGACDKRRLITRPARTMSDNESNRFMAEQISMETKRKITTVLRDFFIDLDKTTYGTKKEKALDNLIQIANDELRSKAREQEIKR